MIAIIDSQTGNIGSLLNALACVEAPAEIVCDPAALARYDALVLPGVGAFDHAMTTLRQRGLDTGIRQFAATGRPVLGICLGMQLLCTGSDEGECAGLGLLDARIEHLAAMGCRGKVPHVGFNDIAQQMGDSPFISATAGQDFYFVHSYGLSEESARRDRELRTAITEYEGARFVAAFQRGMVFATQFHPEKSGEAGVALLQQFVSACPMLKKRLIFVLYYDAGHFYLSRNFRLQRVGDVRWLVDKFRFKAIGRFIDELVILDVSRQATPRCAGSAFSDAVAYLMRQTLVPLTMGGGLSSMADAERCFQLGADKILFNSAVLADPDLVTRCVARFGAQAVIGALDVLPEADGYVTRVGNGQQPALGLAEHLQRTVALGVGEVLVNSIERDGTGMGFDMALIEHCLGLQVPLIVAGGAGKPEHFGQVLRLTDVQAAATGNLFNFIGKGFEQVRHFLLEQQLPVRSTGTCSSPRSAIASEATS